MPPKKGRRGDDSDDDDAPPVKEVPAAAAKGKKGKKGAADADGDAPAPAKASGKGKKGRGDDSDDDVTSGMRGLTVVEASEKHDKGGKKGKADAPASGKGKAAAAVEPADDSDDDGRRKKGAKGKGAARGDADAEPEASGVAKKKGKKAGKGRRGDDDSEEEDAPRGRGKADSDDDEEAAPPKKPGKLPAAAADDDDDDGSDAERERQRLAAVAKAKAAKAAAPAGGKKAAKGKGKKGRHDDDEDDDDDAVPDVLAGLGAPKADDSDDDAKPKAAAGSKASKAAKKAARDAAAQRAKDGLDDEEEAPAAIEILPVAVAEPPVETAAAVDDDAAGGKKKKKKKGGPAMEDAPEAVATEPEAARKPEAAPALAPVTEVVEPAAEVLAPVTLVAPVEAAPAPVVEVVKQEPEPVKDAPVAAPVAAVEAAPAGEEEEVDFSALKKKKKKKAVKLEGDAADTDPAPTADAVPTPAPVQAPAPAARAAAAALAPAAAAAASAPGSFFGEATMGVGIAAAAEDDIPPEIPDDMRKAVLKSRAGETLSNRERRALKDFEERMATLRPLRAGYGATGRTIAGDEYGLSNFSVSQSKAVVAADSAAAENSKDIIIENFGITAHKKELFKNAALRIAHGRRYGFVGPNGQGKTTLLKHIAARELAIPSRISMLYVEQEVVADETPAVQAVLRADKQRAALLEEEARILRDLDAADAAEASGASVGALSDAERGKREERLGKLYDELAAMRADASEASARKILSGLGFTAGMMELPTKQFSGGWRMRISLARALFMQPDLLLLDEPTNHLDLNAVIWLQDYLSRWRTTLFVVSHDQDFLSAVVTDIIHLEDKKLFYYKGNYDDFKEMHQQKVEKQLKDYEKQQKALKSDKEKGKTSRDAKDKELARAKREGAKKDKKGAASAAGGMGDEHDDETGGAAAGSELIARPREYTVHFAFNDPPELPPPIFQVKDVHFRYTPAHPWLFKDINFGIDQSSRIAIVGPNGVGKSTLLNLIIGDLEPTEGEVTRNRFLRVGKYSQHFVDILPMEKSPVEYLQSLFSDRSYQSCRNLLGRFGLEGHAHTIPIRDLSGGQKARVVFASLSLQAPHVMVLDEPTNNLDAESIDALATAIREFQGGVVLVSHDARLIRDAGCLLFVCDKQDISAFDGDIDDYKSSLLSAIHDEEAAMDVVMARRRAEEEAAHMAAARERAQRIKEIRAAKAAAAATGGSAAAGVPSG